MEAQRKIRMAMVGLGKMGLSHLAIVRAHPQVDLVAGCDATPTSPTCWRSTPG
jgi:predicted dehydrogenase